VDAKKIPAAEKVELGKTDLDDVLQEQIKLS